MKWNHLPTNGGLYEQNPDMLDRFYYIFAEKAKHEAAEQKRREAESGRGKSPMSSRASSGRRRR